MSPLIVFGIPALLLIIALGAIALLFTKRKRMAFILFAIDLVIAILAIVFIVNFFIMA